jgi:hypothetical protein
MPGTQLVHKHKVLPAYVGTPSSASLPWVSLKNYTHLTIRLIILNSTTVTGSAVGLVQATAIAGTGSKTLAFSKAWRMLDAAASDTLSEFTVSSDTFTTDSTNSKRMMYQIEIEAEQLDMDNDFDCVRLTLGNAVATTIAVEYVLSGASYGGHVSVLPSAIID